MLVVTVDQSTALQVSLHANACRVDETRELLVARGLRGVKPKLAVGRLREHAIEGDDVEVKIEISG
jgi:hypothetical protein